MGQPKNFKSTTVQRAERNGRSQSLTLKSGWPMMAWHTPPGTFALTTSTAVVSRVGSSIGKRQNPNNEELMTAAGITSKTSSATMLPKDGKCGPMHQALLETC